MISLHCLILFIILAEIVIHNTICEPEAKRARSSSVSATANKVYFDLNSGSCKPLRGSMKIPSSLIYKSKLTCQTQNGASKGRKSIGNTRNLKSLTKGKSSMQRQVSRKSSTHISKKKQRNPNKKRLKNKANRSFNRPQTNRRRKNNAKPSMPKTVISKGTKINRKKVANKRVYKNPVKPNRRRKNGAKEPRKLTPASAKVTTTSPKAKASLKRNGANKPLPSDKGNSQDKSKYIVNKEGKCVKVQNKARKISPKSNPKRVRGHRRGRGKPRMKRMVKGNKKAKRRNPNRRLNRNSSKKKGAVYRPSRNNRLQSKNRKSSANVQLRKTKVGKYPKVKSMSASKQWANEKYSSLAECESHLYEYQQDAPAADGDAAGGSQKMVKLSCTKVCGYSEDQCTLADPDCYSCESYTEADANKILEKAFEFGAMCYYIWGLGDASQHHCAEHDPEEECPYLRKCSKCTAEGYKALLGKDPLTTKSQAPIAAPETENTDLSTPEPSTETKPEITEKLKEPPVESTTTKDIDPSTESSRPTETIEQKIQITSEATKPSTKEVIETGTKPPIGTSVSSTKRTEPPEPETEATKISQFTVTVAQLEQTSKAAKPSTKTATASTKRAHAPAVITIKPAQKANEPAKPPSVVITPDEPKQPPSVVILMPTSEPRTEQTKPPPAASKVDPETEEPDLPERPDEPPSGPSSTEEETTEEQPSYRKGLVDECYIEQGPYSGKCVNVKKFLNKYGALPVQHAVQDHEKIWNTYNKWMHTPVKDIFGAFNNAKGAMGQEGSAMEKAFNFGKTVTFSSDCSFIMEKVPVSNGFLHSLAETCMQSH